MPSSAGVRYGSAPRTAWRKRLTGTATRGTRSWLVSRSHSSRTSSPRASRAATNASPWVDLPEPSTPLNATVRPRRRRLTRDRAARTCAVGALRPRTRAASARAATAARTVTRPPLANAASSTCKRPSAPHAAATDSAARKASGFSATARRARSIRFGRIGPGSGVTRRASSSNRWCGAGRCSHRKPGSGTASSNRARSWSPATPEQASEAPATSRSRATSLVPEILTHRPPARCHPVARSRSSTAGSGAGSSRSRSRASAGSDPYTRTGWVSSASTCRAASDRSVTLPPHADGEALREPLTGTGGRGDR
jgi:hypothetical protein